MQSEAQRASQRAQADSLKAEANTLFSKGKFAAARERYTEAITICPDWAVLYVNRALCHKKRNEPSQSAADAEKALQLERDNMKAHYLLGGACCQLGDYDRAITHLQKALEAAREKNDNIKDEIWHLLAEAKYAHWEREAQKRATVRRELESLLHELPNMPGSTGFDDAPQTFPQSSTTPPLPGEIPVTKIPPASGDSHTKPSENKVALKDGLQALLDQAKERDKPREVHSAYVCPLTMEVFRDPVITPAGHSYEKQAILEHLAKVGPFDPISRNVRVTAQQLIPNLNLRAAVQVFLDEHPYAWGECR